MLKGKALLALGRTDEAGQVLEEARGAAEVIGSRRTLGVILMSLSEVSTRQAKVSEAERFKQGARKIVAYIAEHIEREDLRRAFLDMPLVQAVRGSVQPH